MLWAGSSYPCLLKKGNPLVSTLIPLFISLSLCPRHLFHFHTVLITSQSASQGVISSCWPTSCSGLDHFLVTHWNRTYHHFLKFVPTSPFFNSVNAGVSHIKIIFYFFPLPSHTHVLVSHILQLLFLTDVYQTSSPLLNKRSPYSHRHPAAPLNQYILYCPHVNLPGILLWSHQHLPQAIVVSMDKVCTHSLFSALTLISD